MIASLSAREVAAAQTDGPPAPHVTILASPSTTLQPLNIEPGRGLMAGYALLSSGLGLCLGGIIVTVVAPWGMAAAIGFTIVGVSIGAINTGMTVLAVTKFLEQRELAARLPLGR